MPKIIQLPEEIISKIAAGEVVERPAYALKELIENAIDAHADTIKIEIEQSGLKKIKVTDNGEGMDKKDVLESIKIHTTSKLTKEEQLEHIKTMGFRGEALASIAAISSLTIDSKRSDEKIGTHLKNIYGTTDEISSIGMPNGTQITVTNLFENVPVRKKFLRSLATEYLHILRIVTDFALSYPEISFSLMNNKKVIFVLPKNQPIHERINKLLGETIFHHIIPIQSEEGTIKISGFISKPQIATTSKHKHYIFVNKRSISSTELISTIKTTYGTLLEPRAYPIVLLYISIPYDLVDVNVHPRKEAVHFYNINMVLDLIQKSVSNSLAKHNLTFQDQRWTQKGEQEDIVSIQKQLLIRDSGTKSYTAQLLKDSTLPWAEQKTSPLLSDHIQQIHNLYIVLQTKKGLILIDQHAAHERILYEQLLMTFQKLKKISPQYLLPKTVMFDVSLQEIYLIGKYETYFKELGFDLEVWGNTSIRVHAIPRIFKDHNIQKLVTELLDDIANEQVKNIDTYTQRMIAYLSCRSAIKAGDKLTKDQMIKLVKDLFKSPNNYTCPHGRPTQIEFNLQELNRIFKRK